MKTEFTQQIARQIGWSQAQVGAALKLLSEGATVPFIARYRKEATGGLDESQLIEIQDIVEVLTALEHRKNYVLKIIETQGVLNSALQRKIEDASTIEEVEDLYLPFKKGKQTRADRAREKGLGVIAEKIFTSPHDPNSIIQQAANERADLDYEDINSGVMDILAEIISQNSQVRRGLRELYQNHAILSSECIKARLKNTKDVDKLREYSKFEDYFDWKEKASKAPGHRIHAILRGMATGILRVKAAPAEAAALTIIEKHGLPKNRHLSSGQGIDFWHKVAGDSYQRLLLPSLQNELFKHLKERADKESLHFFASNLHGMLLSPPFKRTKVLAIDPGFRTGCKAVVLDPDGNLIEWKTIFPTPPHNDIEGTKVFLRRIRTNHDIGCIAIGNGTAGRETEEVFRSMVDFPVPIVLVDERGASVYSASESARKEFPDLDLTYRGAISIGRRLQDPLNELVKIDPKSIGVGQYQHDVDQKLLGKRLAEEVEICVNSVGVDLNRASQEILSYISGFNEKTTKAVLTYRQEHGGFSTRKQLLEVPGLGDKLFQQASGFLRIVEGMDPLDRTGIHPEVYHVVHDLARVCGQTVSQLFGKEVFKTLPQKKVSEWKNSWFSENSEFGEPTYILIRDELMNPGRDPRQDFELNDFDADVHEIADLTEGQILSGKVTNITSFGVFVDIGVHQDGLIHISKLDSGFVKDPAQVVSPGQWLKIRIIGVDPQRNRISLERIIPSREKSSP